MYWNFPETQVETSSEDQNQEVWADVAYYTVQMTETWL